MLLYVSVTSNNHQVQISVRGHDMFSAYSMGSHIVYICCVEFQTFRLKNCSVFNILSNVFSEIYTNLSLYIYQLKFKILKPTKTSTLSMYAS
jgi:hypothetical protein